MEMAVLVVVVKVVTVEEMVMMDVASGTKEVLVTVAVVVEVLVMVRGGGVVNLVEMQFVGLMVLVVTMNSMNL